MSLFDMSRELLAQEVREVTPVLIVAATLVVCLFIGYCIGRVQMAKKYSKKNMPEISRKHINYLALKLRTTEKDRNDLAEENKKVVSRLRAIATLISLPQYNHFGSDYWRFTGEQVKDAVPTAKLFGMDFVSNKVVPKNIAVIKNLKKEAK